MCNYHARQKHKQQPPAAAQLNAVTSTRHDLPPRPGQQAPTPHPSPTRQLSHDGACRAVRRVPDRLAGVAEADEEHGQDLDDVRLKQAAQLVAQALKRQQGACGRQGRMVSGPRPLQA
jgi:hypothetical protein